MTETNPNKIDTNELHAAIRYLLQLSLETEFSPSKYELLDTKRTLGRIIDELKAHAAKRRELRALAGIANELEVIEEVVREVHAGHLDANPAKEKLRRYLSAEGITASPVLLEALLECGRRGAPITNPYVVEHPEQVKTLTELAYQSARTRSVGEKISALLANKLGVSQTKLENAKRAREMTRPGRITDSERFDIALLDGPPDPRDQLAYALGVLCKLLPGDEIEFEVPLRAPEPPLPEVTRE
jgi:hypothetical protein